MKRMQIKTKVTLWYTAFMVLLMIIMLGVLVYFSEVMLINTNKERLSLIVEEQLDELEEGEEDDIRFYEDGVSLLIYNENGTVIQGRLPNEFDDTLPLVDGAVQRQSGTPFYYYDRQTVTEEGVTVWLRGIVSNSQLEALNSILFGLLFILMPLLVLVSSIVGYGITKRAFAPIRQIQETAEKIIESKELSTRIALPPGEDEISKLGQTFDDMFEIIEQNFIKEKQFTSDASHELRTPLAVIMTESEFAMKHASTVEDAKESMEVVNRQANRMSKLINHLLFLARADAGTHKLHSERSNITELTHTILEEAKLQAEEKRITLSYVQSEKEDIYMVLDSMLYMRAMQNLTQNAISYGRECGTVQVSIQRQSNGINVMVADDGIGISEDNQSKIWDRFYQVDPARSKQAGSMGLGLSMVKWIVEAHGGDVKVESELEKGSKFILHFPNK